MARIARVVVPGAAKYIARNPVAAGITETAAEYPWSSARAHLRGVSDGLTSGSELNKIAGDWGEFLGEPLSAAEVVDLRKHNTTGRPLGGKDFIGRLESSLGRVLHAEKRGRKPRVN